MYDKGNSQGDAVEEPGESAAAKAEGTAVRIDQTDVRCEEVKTHAEKVGGEEAAFGFNRQTHMKDQNHDGAAQEEARVIADGQPGQQEQQKVHEKRRNVNVFHKQPPFQEYYTSGSRKRQEGMVKLHNY